MQLIKDLSDLRGLLKVDPNSYFPYKDYFSKPLKDDLFFFCRLNTATIIFSDEFERLGYGLGYNDYEKKFGPVGIAIRETVRDVNFVPRQQEIRDIIRLLFKSQTFKEQERVVLDQSKSSNKLLIDIRQTGGEYPYHYILDYAYHVNSEHSGFKNLNEERISTEVSVKDVLNCFNQKITNMHFNGIEEWGNLFRAITAYARGDL